MDEYRTLNANYLPLFVLINHCLPQVGSVDRQKMVVGKDSIFHSNLLWDHALMLLEECPLKEKDNTTICPVERNNSHKH